MAKRSLANKAKFKKIEHYMVICFFWLNLFFLKEGDIAK
jgi:hypothetical protein